MPARRRRVRRPLHRQRSRHARLQACQDPGPIGSGAPAAARVRGAQPRGAGPERVASLELRRAAPVPRGQPRGGQRGRGRAHARRHLGARVRPGRLAARPDAVPRARRADPSFPRRHRTRDPERPRVGAPVVHERRPALLPQGPPRQVRPPAPRDLRRAGPPGRAHQVRRAGPCPRRLPLAGQAVRGDGRQRARGTLGQRHAGARRVGHGLPRARSSGGGTRLPARPDRERREPAMGDRRR